MKNPKSEAPERIHKIVFNGIKHEEKNDYDIKEELLALGVSDETATKIIEETHVAIEEAKNEKAKKDMLYGGLWCIGGIVVTAATYSAAQGGGRYFVAWGAIIFGAIQFIKGVLNRQ